MTFNRGDEMEVAQEIERNRFNTHAAAAMCGLIGHWHRLNDKQIAEAFETATQMMLVESLAWENYLLLKAQATIDTKRKEQGLQ
jgi:hypothetical protein